MGNALDGERPVTNWFKEANGQPKRTERLMNVNTGSPKKGDLHGEGAPIVLKRSGRVMRRAELKRLLEIGEPCTWKPVRTVRRGRSKKNWPRYHLREYSQAGRSIAQHLVGPLPDHLTGMRTWTACFLQSPKRETAFLSFPRKGMAIVRKREALAAVVSSHGSSQWVSTTEFS